MRSRPLMGIRKFRDSILKIEEPVTVIRRDEVIGVWTPAKRKEGHRGQQVPATPEDGDPVPAG